MAETQYQPHTPEPQVLYRAIASNLRKALLTGRWAPGAKLPTESELAEEFRVSQGTMRLAILELVKAGLLYRQQGRGTFVSEPRFDLSLERFFRFLPDDPNKSATPETRVLGEGLVEADDAVREALMLSSGEQVGWLRRLRLVDGAPFLFHDSYFPRDLWEVMKLHCDFAETNLYRQLQAHCDSPVLNADEFLSAAVASSEEAAILGIAPGAAVAHIERHAFTFGPRKIEFRRGTGRGDRFSYRVRL